MSVPTYTASIASVNCHWSSEYPNYFVGDKYSPKDVTNEPKCCNPCREHFVHRKNIFISNLKPPYLFKATNCLLC